MAWVKLDDAFPEHEKAERVGDHAAWLFVCSLCYANRNRTDGLIPRARVSKLTGLSRPMKLAGTLVDAGLWEREGDDFRIHDYHDFQPSRSQLEAGDSELSAARAAAGRKGAESRWGGKRGGKTDGKPVASEKQTGRQTDAPVPVARTRTSAVADAAVVVRVTTVFADEGIAIDGGSVERAVLRFDDRDLVKGAIGFVQWLQSHPRSDIGLAFHRYMEREPVAPQKTTTERRSTALRELMRRTDVVD